MDLESALLVSHGTCISSGETYLGLGVNQVGKEGELDGPVLSCLVSLIPEEGKSLRILFSRTPGMRDSVN